MQEVHLLCYRCLHYCWASVILHEMLNRYWSSFEATSGRHLCCLHGAQGNMGGAPWIVRASETRTRVKITPRENAYRFFLRGVIFTRALPGATRSRSPKKLIWKTIGSLHDLITWSTFGKDENSSLLKNFVSTSWKSIRKIGNSHNLKINYLKINYLKSNVCNGRRKLDSFVWEKQLLQWRHQIAKSTKRGFTKPFLR